MIKKAILSIVGAVVLALCPSASQAAQLLVNGNFESPLQTTPGDHIGTLPANWIVAESANATTSVANDSNLVYGTVTNGTGVTMSSQNLGICPDDPTGHQSLDGNGKTVYVIQSFTLGGTSTMSISVDIGGRDVGSASGTGSSWQVVNSGGAVVAAASGITVATGSWTKSSLTTATLPAGSYSFIVTLLDPDMMDAASITGVPEPSTFAAAGIGLGLLGWVVSRRRRRA